MLIPLARMTFVPLPRNRFPPLPALSAPLPTPLLAMPTSAAVIVLLVLARRTVALGRVTSQPTLNVPVVVVNEKFDRPVMSTVLIEPLPKLLLPLDVCTLKLPVLLTFNVPAPVKFVTVVFAAAAVGWEPIWIGLVRFNVAPAAMLM